MEGYITQVLPQNNTYEIERRQYILQLQQQQQQQINPVQQQHLKINQVNHQQQINQAHHHQLINQVQFQQHQQQVIQIQHQQHISQVQNQQQINLVQHQHPINLVQHQQQINLVQHQQQMNLVQHQQQVNQVQHHQYMNQVQHNQQLNSAQYRQQQQHVNQMQRQQQINLVQHLQPISQVQHPQQINLVQHAQPLSQVQQQQHQKQIILVQNQQQISQLQHQQRQQQINLVQHQQQQQHLSQVKQHQQVNQMPQQPKLNPELQSSMQQHNLRPVRNQRIVKTVQQKLPSKNNPSLQVFQNQNIPRVTGSTNATGVMDFVTVNTQTQVSSNGNNVTASNRAHVVGSSYYVPQPTENATSNMHFNAGNIQINVMQVNSQGLAAPQSLQLNVEGDMQQDYQTANPPDPSQKKRMASVPEPTQVKINREPREMIGGLKVRASGSFLSWNVTDRTVLDLNFMRNLFYITNIDVKFQPNMLYETGVCEGLKKIVHNNHFSDWLVLKCEEKQVPFFKVNNQIEIYSVNSFTALLSIIAQDTCLPLPFITRHEKTTKYFYLNFPKSSNNRVRKLNTPIFHDADNGRKKIPCKQPGIRLDCSFENAIQRFIIYVEKSAIPAFKECVTYIRQVIIYNHIVWGFLQAWTRRIKEQYNGCFKGEDIAQNLSLCQRDLHKAGKTLTDENDLIYYVDYSNFYLKFDPVTLKDTSVSFTIENFETNFVSDVSIVQYYRQFFLINDMHYSDALKNVILFSEENGANNVTEFMYMEKRYRADRSKVGYFLPGGISRPASRKQILHSDKRPIQSNVRMVPDVSKSTKQESQLANPNVPSECNGASSVERKNVEPVLQATPSNISPPLSKPLLKTRTVEEINSSVELKKCINGSQISFDSILPRQHTHNNDNPPPCIPPLPPCIREVLNHCFLMHTDEVSSVDVTTDPKVQQTIFTDSLKKAMGMTSIEGFIDKLYVSLQKYFTNATCQLIMRKTIARALTIRFPNLKARLLGGLKNKPQQKETEQSRGDAATGARSQKEGKTENAPKPSLRVREVKGKKHLPAKEVVSPSKKTSSNSKPEQQSKKLELALQDTNTVNFEEPRPNGSDVNPVLTSTPKPTGSVSPSCDRNSMLTRTTTTRNDEVKKSNRVVDIDFDYEKKASELVELSKEVNGNPNGNTTPTRNTYDVPQASMTLVESDNNISIELRLPFTNPPEGFISQKTPKKASSQERLGLTISNTAESLDSPTTPKRVVCKEEPITGVEGVSVERQEIPRQAEQPVKLEPISFDCEESERKPLQVTTTPEATICEATASRDSIRTYDVINSPEATPPPEVTPPPVVAVTPEVATTSEMQDLYARHSIRPCTILLNTKDIENYEKNLQRKRKRKPASTSFAMVIDGEDADDNQGDDSRCNNLTAPGPSKKKQKKISELEYLEAKMRVLQRLRKRNRISFDRGNGRHTYTTDELEQFLVQNPPASSALPSTQTEGPEKAKSNTEDSQYRALCDECLKRKAVVGLTRLEDTPELGKRNYVWRVETKEDGRLTLTRDYVQECGSVPKNKQKYFEIKDGKLYLKEEYQVKNGRIMPINQELNDVSINLKNEPPSTDVEVSDGSNFLLSTIKREVILE